MKRNKRLNRNQKLVCTERQESKWFIMMAKIEFLERKKHRLMSGNVPLRGTFSENYQVCDKPFVYLEFLVR